MKRLFIMGYASLGLLVSIVVSIRHTIAGFVAKFVDLCFEAARPFNDTFRIDKPGSILDMKRSPILPPVYELSRRTNAQNINSPMLLC